MGSERFTFRRSPRSNGFLTTPLDLCTSNYKSVKPDDGNIHNELLKEKQKQQGTLLAFEILLTYSAAAVANVSGS